MNSLITVGINVGNRIVSIYSLDPLQGKTDLMLNVLCETGMSSICFLTPSILCSSLKTSFKVFKLE